MILSASETWLIQGARIKNFSSDFHFEEWLISKRSSRVSGWIAFLLQRHRKMEVDTFDHYFPEKNDGDLKNRPQSSKGIRPKGARYKLRTH